MPQLRPYQSDLLQSVIAEFQRVRGVLMRLATGGGKTVILGAVVKWFVSLPLLALPWHTGVSCVLAHRQELVAQLSMQLAREGIYHDVIAADGTRRDVVRQHMEELGRNFVLAGANAKVASVDTLVRQLDEPWVARVGLFIPDEGHHVLQGNKWGKVVAAMPLARILMPSATPTRADGKGLGSHAHGYADVMVAGPSQRWLIDSGYLTPYRLIIPENRVDLSSVKLNSEGDFSQRAAAAAVEKAQITGDVVATYLKFARGKRGVTFAVDVEHAVEIAAAYRAAGVPAEAVSGKTPDTLRRKFIRMLRTGELLQLVNCDLFGEGFDLPAIEVISMARPTQSFALYAQQFGRALRILEGKAEAIIIDHVGNIERHNGPPDWRTFWTLDAREQRNSGPSLIKRCPNPECARGYLRELGACPYCDGGVLKAAPTARALPEQVDGNMAEVDPDWIAAKAREIARINGDPVALPVGLAARAGAFAQHKRRRDAADAVRLAMDTWAACQGSAPLDVLNRRFYLKFGTDVMSAQTLSRPEAEDLRGRIEASIVADGFVINEVVQ